ncbi:Fc.00g108220.m01.CDS01 [Cosmosporella sp. VM-42]
MNNFFLMTLAATGALADYANPFLAARQIVQVPCSEQGLKDCGVGCINLSWTCCPSRAGGCPPSARCNLGSDGEYNCCPLGAICAGPGGATTLRSTDTIIIPGETSTIIQESTSTSTIIGEPTTTSEPTVPAEPTTSSTTEQPPPPATSTTVIPPTTYTTTVESTLTQPSATPIPLPTPVNNGTTTSTSSIAIVNAGAANGFSASNLLSGLLAGAAALLI